MPFCNQNAVLVQIPSTLHQTPPVYMHSWEAEWNL